MGAWLPVPGTTTGRLVEAALDLFGAQGYDAVPVAAIAARAGVTTGPLYHHFNDKAGLYRLVRSDVEQRVRDRIETAAALRPVHSTADLAPVLLIGYDYLVTARLTRLLAEEPPTGTGAPDAVEQAIDQLLPAMPPLGFLVAAAWRAALWRAGDGPDAALQARDSFAQLLTGPTPTLTLTLTNVDSMQPGEAPSPFTPTPHRSTSTCGTPVDGQLAAHSGGLF